MPKARFSFGKITGTPTNDSWSQAYNAGALFVVLSLHHGAKTDDTEPLAAIGKSFLNELEAEFFSLDEKTLEKIRLALEKPLSSIPEPVAVTSLLAYLKESTLYLLLVGQGSIVIKRGNKIGTLLAGDTTDREIHLASGKVVSGDRVFLATSAFRQIVPDETLKEALSLNDTEAMTESLTPHVHKTKEGNACAIVFHIEAEKESPQEEAISSQSTLQSQEYSSEEKDDGTSEVNRAYDEYENREPEMREHPQHGADDKSQTPKPSVLSKGTSALPLSLFRGLSHRRKVFLSIAFVILVILLASIFFTVSNQQAQERRTLFNEIYPEALESYEQAEGIISLNKIQARVELEEAQHLLAKTDGKFPRGTEEFKQTEALRQKIDSLLSQLGESVEVEATEVASSDNLLLASLIPQDRIAVVEDETSVYYLTEDEIGSIRKASKSEQELVTNDGDWDRPVGLGKFGSNFYVLDQSNGILKFVPSGSDYSVSDYLTEDVDMSDATSMAIDASVYVLFDTGRIKKFNRGAEDEFSINGLETPFSSPVQIYTTEEIDHLYVLDPKASRIVKLSKSGEFVEEYLSKVLTDAKGFYVSSDEQQAYVLSGGKIYSLSI